MISDLASVAPRIGQLVRLLASDRDGEVVAAARALARTLKSVGADFHTLADLVERPSLGALELPAPRPESAGPADAAAWLRRYHWSRLNEKEQGFILQMMRWRGAPTERQSAWLGALVERMPGGQRRRA
jgi:hypothetical protein